MAYRYLLTMRSLSILSILSRIRVITVKNPVISVLYLIGVFISISLYLIVFKLAYLGLVYLIVYVGAIAILFLFVIMMLNLQLVDLIETGQEYTQSLPMASLLRAMFLGIFSGLGSDSSHCSSLFDLTMKDTVYFYQQIESIGQGLYTYASI